MYNRTACKVKRAHLAQETAAPYPVCNREIYEGHPEYRKHYPRRELHPFDIRAACKGNGDGRKGQLVDDEDILRYCLGQIIDASRANAFKQTPWRHCR